MRFFTFNLQTEACLYWLFLPPHFKTNVMKSLNGIALAIALLITASQTKHPKHQARILHKPSLKIVTASILLISRPFKSAATSSRGV